MTPIQSDDIDGFVTVTVCGQNFGVPVLDVRDVIDPVRIDTVPLAPPEVAGVLNLRGRIVTAVELRMQLGMPHRADADRHMSVIVEHDSELYAILVDDVGDVLWLPRAGLEPPPVTLAAQWRDLCSGLHRLDGDLLLILSVEKTLALDRAAAAAA